MQRVKPFVFNKMKENGFVVWDEAGKTAVLVDPGCASQQELDVLETFLDQNALRPTAILVTHPHFDHVAGADRLCRNYGVDCFVCATDRALLGQREEWAKLYHFTFDGQEGTFHFFPAEEKALRFGDIAVQVLPLGGHTAGSTAYYFPDAEAVFVGDTVVKGSLGFLETGFQETLERIRDCLLPLPDDTRVYFGHGAASTIGEEKRENRFFKRSAALGKAQ